MARRVPGRRGRTGEAASPSRRSAIVGERVAQNGRARAQGGKQAWREELDVHAIRVAANFSAPLGDGRFKVQIVRVQGRAVARAVRGRPSRVTARNASE